MAFAGFPLSEKLSLIRKLIEERTKGSLFGRLFLNVSHVDAATLMGCPEATIVTLVESYYLLREQGVSAASALSTIEQHRSSTTRGSWQAGSDLEDYVRYRVRLEHRRGRRISDLDISRACFLASALAEKHIAEEKQIHSQADQSDEDMTDFVFMSELPHLESNRQLGTFKSDQVMFGYYEYPRSIGSVVAGIEPPYSYPQVVVVSDEERPLVIIRSERNPSGALFLCSLDASGTRRNWGRISPMSRDDFVRRAGEIVVRMKWGEAGGVTTR